MHRLRHLAGWGGVFAALALLGGLSLEPVWSQDRQVQQKSVQEKIQEIEKKLAEISAEVAALKKAEEASAEPARSPETDKPAADKPADVEPRQPVSPDGGFPAEWVRSLTWRAIGPAAMGGRITAIAVYEADPSIWWVATASGGLLKTTNNGITFEHQFDKEATVSIGDVAVAPSDPNIVWVGTGENNPRNSVSYGDGVYKSTDGGKTWKNMGLKKSFQIGKILIHPTDPNIVYVGALGRLYGPNEERGLFKTIDGGNTWEKILYIDDKTGVIDMRMHPTDPETLIVATWERQRDEYDGFFGNVEGDQYGPIKTHAPGTGLYKTTDGGKTWRKLTQGLPTCNMGRIGLDWYRKDPNVVFAIIDTEKVGMTTAAYLGVQGNTAKEGVALTSVVENGPAAKAGLKAEDVILSLGGKEVKEFADIGKILDDFMAGDKIEVTFKRGDERKTVEVELGTRPAQAGAAASGLLFAGFIAEDVEGGFRVTRLLAEDSPLRVGDVVQLIDEKPVSGFRETFQQLAGSKRAGDKIKVQFDRDGEKKEAELTLTAPPFGGAGGRGGVGAVPGRTTRPFASTLGGQRENVQNQQGKGGFNTGGVFKSTDGGETWVRINSLNPRPMYFSQVRVDPSDDKYVYVLGVSLYRSNDGGTTFRPDGGRGVHADHHALWINPRDGRHMILGTDGGFYVTYDRMNNWDHLNTAALGQFYHVCVDPRKDYRVYGGLQDNGSWGGPARVRSGSGPVNEDWFRIGGGDGFTCRVDPNDPDLVYFTSQNGAMGRRNLRTGEVASIRPRAPGGPSRGEPGQRGEQAPRGEQPGQAEAQPQPAEQREREEQPRAAQQSRYRWNWNTPFILSHHNSRIFYCAANFVFRSLDRGNDLQVISPEITASEKGSGTALSESPRNPNVLYAGTDDGMIWVTRDGGKTWKEVGKNLPLPKRMWVSTLEASRFADGRCYVCIDGHRSDDDNPYVFVTEDYGETWKPITSNLPWGSTRCLREDLQNPNLLFVGTEFAVFASTNRGVSWTKINNNLPTVAVHELAIHPSMGEMVAATHGRSLWILDITPLRQISNEVLSADAALLKPNTAIRWRSEPSRGGTNRRFVGSNGQSGAHIYYVLNKNAERVSVKILDIEGKVVRELRANSTPGMHRVTWDLTRVPERPAGTGQRSGSGQAGGRGQGQQAGAAVQPSAGQAPAAGQQPGQPPSGFGGFGRGGFGGFGGQPVPPGTYRVVLTVDGKEYSQVVRVESDPNYPNVDLIASEEEEYEEEEAEENDRNLIPAQILFPADIR